MMISKRETVHKCRSRDSSTIPNAKLLEVEVDNEPVTFLKGSFTITFEPIDEKLVQVALTLCDFDFFGKLAQSEDRTM